MGGAIQGKPLNLTNTVSTLAGKPDPASGADGTTTEVRFGGARAIARHGTNLYVTDNETIRKIDMTTNEVTTFAGKYGDPGYVDGTGNSARFRGLTGIATDGTNLYVTDTWNHTIRKIAIATGIVTTLAGKAGEFGNTDAKVPIGIATDSYSVYVTTGHAIKKIDMATNTVTTFAGNSDAWGTNDGTGTAARFDSPRGLTTDGTNLYVANTNNDSIRKIVIATAAVTTVAGKGGNNPGTTDGIGAEARFRKPWAITTDGINLYVSDTENGLIRKIVIATGAVTTQARIGYPEGITIDGNNLYVISSSSIRKIVIDTAAVTTFAGWDGFEHSSIDGVGTEARFLQAYGTTTDGKNLYVTDIPSHTIRKIDTATGAVTTIAGTSGSSGGADGTGTAASFNRPLAITTDGVNLYVADTSNHTIRKIVITTAAVTTLAGKNGETGSADGMGSMASFNSPSGITTDGTNLYVTDAGNYTIRKIVIATGAVTTISGKAGVMGFTDGTGAEARFYSPIGITTDGSNLYVTDDIGCVVRKIVISTSTTTTLAGKVGNYGYDDGTGGAALFASPVGITTDGTSLYVEGGGALRKILPATGEVTTLIYGNMGGGITTDGTYLYLTDSYYKTIQKIH